MIIIQLNFLKFLLKFIYYYYINNILLKFYLKINLLICEIRKIYIQFILY